MTGKEADVAAPARQIWQLAQEGPLLKALRTVVPEATGVDILHRRLRPDDSALYSLLCHFPKQQSLRAYLRLQPAPRGRAMAAKWRHLCPKKAAGGPGVRVLFKGAGLLFFLPNDHGLRLLPQILRKDKLKRQLALALFGKDSSWRIRGRRLKLEILRYKPEHRLVARAQLSLVDDRTQARGQREVILRLFPEARAFWVTLLMTFLRQKGFEQQLPKGQIPFLHGHLLLEEALPGRSLKTALLSDWNDAESLATLLVKLHQTTVQGLPQRDGNAFRQRVSATLSFLVRHEPALGRRLAELFSELAPAFQERGNTTLIHGDCHVNQFLEHAGRLALLDWDRAGRGHPLLDLGSLLADVDILSLDHPGERERITSFRTALEHSYLAQGKPSWPDKLKAFEGAALLLRAAYPLRRLQTRWRERVEQILALVEQRLRGAHTSLHAPICKNQEPSEPAGVKLDSLSWQTLYPRPGRLWPGRAVSASDKAIGYLLFDPRASRLTAAHPEEDHHLKTLAQWLPRGTLVAYRPGSRATLRLEGQEGRSFLKLMKPARLAAAVGRHRAARACLAAAPEVGLTLPCILAEMPEEGGFLIEALPGPSLYRVLMEERPAAAEALQQVGAALARLHALTPPSSLPPGRNPNQELKPLVGEVGRFDTPLAMEAKGVLEGILQKAARHESPPARLVHGDLHDKNILLTPAGPAWIDLDGAGLGDPASDLGNLMAHLILRALQRHPRHPHPARQAEALLGAYQRAPGLVSKSTSTLEAAHSLVRLAALYRFRRGNPSLPGNLLREARRAMGREGSP